MVQFAPGFCFSGVALDGTTRVVVNVCGHDSVGVPLAKNMNPVDEKYIDERGIDNLIIPISVGVPTRLPDTEEYNFRIDVVVHTWLTRRCAPKHHFFRHLIEKLTELALEWVKQEAGIVIAPPSCKCLGTFYFGRVSPAGEEGSPAQIREMADKMFQALKEAQAGGSGTQTPDHDGETALPSDLKLSPAGPPKWTKPLIQEVVAIAPGIKKGFLLGGNSRLYDKHGSPEGQGKQPDPLMHIPQSIRDKCKVIDTRNMDSSALHQELLRQEGVPLKPSSLSVAPAPVIAAGNKAAVVAERWKLESVSVTDTAATIRVITEELLKGVADVDLSVSPTEVILDNFSYSFPRPIDEDSVKAKYIKASRTLVLTCPFT